MYRYQTKHKVLSLLLVFSLLILTTVLVFPSPVLAQDEVWDCPGFPRQLVVPPLGPQYCSGDIVPPLPEVKTLILEVEKASVPFGVGLLVDLGQLHFVSLHWDWQASPPQWKSDWTPTHVISVTPGPVYDIIEVTFTPPIPEVEQVCLTLGSTMYVYVIVYMLQLVYSPSEDFGDAPDPTYPTLLANNGARHQITGLFLGASVDNETDGQPNANATGDDINNDDEDGVTFTTLLIPGNAANVSVVASAAGQLDAWVDFNGDGDWSDADEQVSTNQTLALGANNLSFGVPAGAASGSTFARFRVSSNGGFSFVGLAPDGEVEDYKILISEPEEPPVTKVGGTVYPVNKVSVLAPWIALSAAIIAGAIIAIRRRSVRN